MIGTAIHTVSNSRPSTRITHTYYTTNFACHIQPELLILYNNNALGVFDPPLTRPKRADPAPFCHSKRFRRQRLRCQCS